MSERRSNAVVWTVVGTVGLIAFWELIVRALDVRPMVLLAPSRIVSTFVDDPGPYVHDAWVTAQHLVYGLSISLVISLLIGAALAAVRPLEHASQPMLVLVMVTPWVAYITSVVLIVGSGQRAVVFLVAFVTIPAFVYATVGGMRSADPSARELFSSIDASRWEVLWRLRLPSALPSLFTAMRFNIGLGLGAAYFAEGAALRLDGLGDTGRRAASFSDGEGLWTTILCTAVLGLLAQVTVALVERSTLRWHQSQR
ncbi:MAG: ABC transporter permease subunit [Ilumatobacter sp.]|nr:ABC transporter permease subunit [Ilumatobacter sp.]